MAAGSPALTRILFPTFPAAVLGPGGAPCMRVCTTRMTLSACPAWQDCTADQVTPPLHITFTGVNFYSVSHTDFHPTHHDKPKAALVITHNFFHL